MILPLQTIPTPDPAELAKVQDSIEVAKKLFVEEFRTDPHAALSSLGEQAIQFGLKVLAALLIYFVGMWLIGKIKKLIKRNMTRRGADPTVISFTLSITSALSIILLITISISTLGVNTSSLAALLAGGSVAIGMALSGTMQNFAGGIILLIFKPFKAGDFIRFNGYEGVVTAVSMVSTTLTTTDNKVIIIPNGSLSSGTIDNFNKNPLRRLDFHITVEYGTDAEKCKAALLEIASADERILSAETPGASDPYAALFAMNDSNVEFLLRVWVKTPDYWGVKFDTTEKIYTALPKAGMSFAFPHVDVSLRSN